MPPTCNLDFWYAIENVAKEHNLTLSALAILCGYDATAFNKSKWFDKYGKPRWPNAKMIYSIIATLHMTMIDFCRHMPNGRRFIDDASDNRERA